MLENGHSLAAILTEKRVDYTNPITRGMEQNCVELQAWANEITTLSRDVDVAEYMRIIVTHYNDVIMSAMASQITSLTIVYSSVYQGADQRKHQSSASLAFMRGIHRRPVNSPHKGSVTRKIFPFDDVIMLFVDSPARLADDAEVQAWALELAQPVDDGGCGIQVIWGVQHFQVEVQVQNIFVQGNT